MPLVLQGATSGQTTINATDAVTATITLPSTTGTLSYADGSGGFQMNSGYGSFATAYGCRAWVNFNGTGTVAIRASGNVSSITDRGVGQYTVNLTIAMPDANYAVVVGSGDNITSNTAGNTTQIINSSSFQYNHFENNTVTDIAQLFTAIFR